MFELDEKGDQIVTGRNKHGWDLGVETLTLTDGDHCILIQVVDTITEKDTIRSIQRRTGVLSLFSWNSNKWIANGQNYDPHGCYIKGLVHYFNRGHSQTT